jgi:hypothetical protein
MTHTGRQCVRYGALTLIIAGAVLLGDAIYGHKVSFAHAIGVLLLTAGLFALGGALKLFWSRLCSHARDPELKQDGRKEKAGMKDDRPGVNHLDH